MLNDFTIEHLDPRALTPSDLNPRLHPENQREALAASLDAHGWLAAPIVNRRTGNTILDGHARVEEALRRGEKKVPCRVIDVPREQELRILATFDKTGEMRELDDALLAALLRECMADGSPPPAGWSEEEVGNVLLAAAGDAGIEEVFDGDPDEIPEEVETRAQPGEVWALGAHRILCGSSVDATLVRGFLANEEIRLVWTDPHYGVSYADKNAFLNEADGGRRNTRAIQGDASTEAATEALCRDALALACEFAVPGGSCYVACPPGTLLPYFIAAFDTSGFRFRWQLVWVKQNFVLGRSDYHFRHENILYGWKEGGHYFVDEHNHSSVFEVPKPRRSEEPPTMKPVALIEAMVRNSSKRGEIVYDPFGGSGSTLVACEALGRKARLVELEPRYVDVTIARFEALTGKTAERLS